MASTLTVSLSATRPAMGRREGGGRVGAQGPPSRMALRRRARPSSVAARAQPDFTVPEQVLSLKDVEGAHGNAATGVVKYTLRFYTGGKMGQGLDVPDAGVQVMLIGDDGRAFMQRIDRYPDVAGMPDLALYSSPRFERGAIDEFTFDAPDLGLPVALWVAPEGGGEWYLEEVELSCSEGSVMAAEAADGSRPSVISFPCMEVVGRHDPALELRPSAYVRMTAEQREAMRAEGLKEYGELKVRMLAATGVAVLAGCAVTAAVSKGPTDSLEDIRAFASGGGVGLVYLWMLTRSVDTMGPAGGAHKSGLAMVADAVTSVVASGPMRLLLLGLVGAAGSQHMAAANMDPVSGVGHPAYGEALAAVLGFFTYKAGVMVAGFAGTDVGLGGPGEGQTQAQPVPVNDNHPRRVDAPWW